jgi:thiol-disulfide isomerase/thioredoxin
MGYNEKYLKYKAKYLKLKSIIDKQDLTIMSGGGSDSNSDKKIYLFKADWCPHCRMFKSTWADLEKQLKDKIKFITYDADKHADKIKLFNVQGFPTIILTVGDKAIEYVGPRDEASLKEFINQYN